MKLPALSVPGLTLCMLVSSHAMAQTIPSSQTRILSVNGGQTISAPDLGPWDTHACDGITGGNRSTCVYQTSSMTPSGVHIVMNTLQSWGNCRPGGCYGPAGSSSFSYTFSVPSAITYIVSGTGIFYPSLSLDGPNGQEFCMSCGHGTDVNQTGTLMPGTYTLSASTAFSGCSSGCYDPPPGQTLSFDMAFINYTMDSFTIDCGGGSTAGGSLTLDGTIGQYDASAPLAGGSLALTGGFWTSLTPPCLADFNHDSSVDFFDYLDFVDAFSMSAPAADFNHDSVIDFFDYLDFVDAFSMGC